jgi:hypothetical protein
MSPQYIPETFLNNETGNSQSCRSGKLLDAAIGGSGRQVETNVKNDVRKNKFSGRRWAELV